MKFLIGDIGNTSTKICILNRKFKILRSYNFDTMRMYKGNFLKKIIRKKNNKNINPVFLFSSVVPKVFKNLEKSLKLTKFKILEIKNLKLNKIIKINIKKKKNLGSDRIANAIGAKKFKNCLIIDFGTATTFDVIKNGIYDGGVIAPGVNLSIKN
jgi:pantothenate kinase, type III